MGDILDDAVYIELARKIDQNPETAPKAEDGIGFHPAFIDYLKLLYSPGEAELVRHLNVLPGFMSSQEVADASGISLEEVEKILGEVLSRNGLAGMGNMYCIQPIPMLVNHHNWYSEIRPNDLEAGRLYDEYFIKGGFSKYYESSEKGTPMVRALPVHQSIAVDQRVLPAEEAHDYIRNYASDEIALVPCPCRTRTEKLGKRECKDTFPIGSCIMLGEAARHFHLMDLGRKVTKQEAIDYFDRMVELGCVGQAGNAVSNNVTICLCCGCCCSQVRGRTKWGNPDAMLPSNFVPHAGDDCIGCGTCTEKCFFEALTIDEVTDQAKVDSEKCIGCGVCSLACPEETLKLHRFQRSTPMATFEEAVMRIYNENHES